MNQGSSTSYAVSGEMTEWEDILIKKGITTKDSVLMGKGLNPLDFMNLEEEETEEETDRAQSKLDGIRTLDDIDALEDDPDFSDTKVLEDYRAARLRQIQQERARNRFGDVVEIIKDEWISQVTEGSKAGYWVIVHLYQDSVIECRLVEEALQQLAPKFKYIKFLKIRSTQAIENWPERNLPTIFAYKNGSMQRQLLTLKEVGGKTMKPADLEWWLVQKDIVTTSELEEDPRETVDFQEGNKGKLSKASRYAQERNYNDEDD